MHQNWIQSVAGDKFEKVGMRGKEINEIKNGGIFFTAEHFTKEVTVPRSYSIDI